MLQRNKNLLRLLISCSVLLIGAGSLPCCDRLPARRLTVLFTGDVWGAIEPCG
ncbi:MAG: hypothetical protein GY868_03855 [Deltaproteobacteria bacterium]|nr:hypothetical protein [Deltaproteobacteria bacterium]